MPGRDGGKGTWERHACSRLCELVSERGLSSREVCHPAQTSATLLVKTASTINVAHVLPGQKIPLPANRHFSSETADVISLLLCVRAQKTYSVVLW